MNERTGRPPDAILFDLDNTLCTFIEAKIAACAAVIQLIGEGEGDELFSYFMRPKYGFEDTRHIDDYLEDRDLLSPEISKEAADIFEETKINHIHLYPGVGDTLDRIVQYPVPMAIVTDASQVQARKRLMKCGINDFFPVVVTPDISGRRKPDHATFRYALRELRVSSPDIWLVGDSIRREMIPGNELGYTTIHARYGDWIGGEPEIKPTYTIDSFSELIPLLEETVSYTR